MVCMCVVYGVCAVYECVCYVMCVSMLCICVSDVWYVWCVMYGMYVCGAWGV